MDRHSTANTSHPHRPLFLDDMFAQRVAHHTVLTTISWCVYVGFARPPCFWLARNQRSALNLSAFGLPPGLCRQQICFGICITDMTGTDVPTLYLFLSIIVLILSAYFWHRNGHDGAESLPFTPYGEAPHLGAAKRIGC